MTAPKDEKKETKAADVKAAKAPSKTAKAPSKTAKAPSKTATKKDTKEMTAAEKKAAVEAKKAAAKEAAGKKGISVTRDTIKFKANSGSGIVFSVLEKAKKPLTIEEIVKRATDAGIKNPKRASFVATWFYRNGIATKNEKGEIALVPAKAPAKEAAAASK
jgi:hypothetical protein